MPRIQQGKPENLSRRRALRSEMTTAERKLWLQLRCRQIQGLKFRRQHGIGPYIVDFYCPEKLLVVEVDGDVHGENFQIIKDQKRESKLRSLGVEVIRYTNDEILNNLEGVLEDFNRRLSLRSTSPNPSLQRRGECRQKTPPLCKGRLGGVDNDHQGFPGSTSPNPSLQRRGS